jgi:hypothetical protein
VNEKALAFAKAFSSMDENELLDRLHRRKPSAVAMVSELDAAGDFRKERVVRPDTYIGSRLNASAALTHDNRSAGNQLAREGLHAKALCV